VIASRRVISFTPALILCQFFLFSLSLSLSLCLAPSPRSPARCCLRWNSSSRRTSRVRGAKASDDRSFVSNENSLLLLLSFNVRLLRHGHGPSAVGIRTDGHHEICQKNGKEYNLSRCPALVLFHRRSLSVPASLSSCWILLFRSEIHCALTVSRCCDRLFIDSDHHAMCAISLPRLAASLSSHAQSTGSAKLMFDAPRRRRRRRRCRRCC